MTTNWIYRADLTVLSGGVPTVYRYATRGYAAPPTSPTAPNTYIEGRLDQPLLFRRELYGTDLTHGDSQIAQGECVLNNSDGGLDGFWLSYGFDGRKFELYQIDPNNLASEKLIFRGIMGPIALDLEKLTVPVYDLTYVLNRPLQTTKYAGNNSLPNGLEGTINDLQGKPKPMVYGSVLNVSPPLVNTSRLIYQLHDRALFSGFTLAVYDKRVQLSAGISRVIGDFTSGATVGTVSSIDTSLDQITLAASVGFLTADPVHVDATTTLPGGVLNTRYYYARVISSTVISLHPTATDATNNTNKVDITSVGAGTITVAKNRTPYGCYDWCSDSSGSYIRTGSQPTLLTCDIVNGTNVGFSTVFNQVLTLAGTTYSDIAALSFVEVDRFSDSSQVGFFWNEETTFFAALQEVARSVNASFQGYVDLVTTTRNQIVVERLTAGGVAPGLSLDDTNIIQGSIKRIEPQDPERGITPWRITCNYKRNYTVMSGADVAGAAASDIAFVAQEYRSLLNDNPSVLTDLPSAPELVVSTNLVAATDANTYASYLRTLLAEANRMIQLTIPLEVYDSYANGVFGLLIGETQVSVSSSRVGGVYGPLACTIDRQAGIAELTLWG